MLKEVDLVKMEEDGIGAVSLLLQQIPDLHVRDIEREHLSRGRGIDFVVRFEKDAQPYRLLCEVKSSGTPKSANQAIHQLISYQSRHGRRQDRFEALVFVAPYVSPQVREMCRDYDVNYVDLLGNCRLVLPGLYVDRQVATTPQVETRDLKSLFKPKSARVLRYLLKRDQTARRLSEIAEATQVSIGQVHKLKTALVERDWIEDTPDGFVVRHPDLLVDAWLSANEPPQGRRQGFYTVLHDGALERAVELAVERAGPAAALCGRSAANWWAPWLRASNVELYADPVALPILVDALDLQPAAKGGNVWITVLDESGPLLDAEEVRLGVRATSPLQTYLDLSRGGERDREAADHLRREILPW